MRSGSSSAETRSRKSARMRLTTTASSAALERWGGIAVYSRLSLAGFMSQWHYLVCSMGAQFVQTEWGKLMKNGNNEAENSHHSASVVKKQNVLVRFIYWYWGKSDGAKRGDPVSRTLFALLLVLIGVGASELYQWTRNVLLGPDDYLVQIKADQEKSFDKLQQSLKELNSSLSNNNRDAISQVRGAVQEIRHLNEGLVARLALAQSENARMARTVRVPGGLQFVMSENSGVALDSQSYFGVSNISNRSADVRVSAKEGGGADVYMHSGEFISYTGANGTTCRLVLLSIESNSAASFANTCDEPSRGNG